MRSKKFCQWSVSAPIKLLVIIFLSGFCLTANAKAAQYKIWYIPLARNFYAPVTSETIDGQAEMKMTRSNPSFDKLFTEVEKKLEFKGIKSGDDFRIKFMRKSDGRIVYINRDKSVSFDGILVSVPTEKVQEIIRVIEKTKK